MNIEKKAEIAQKSAIKLGALNEQLRIDALNSVIDALINNKEKIIRANNIDLENAKRDNIAQPLIKRLKFDKAKINDVVNGIKSLINMPDILNYVLLKRELYPNLNLYKKACPIGVIAIIFESRPDALIQISALCIKSGNAVLLKGGSEAKNTNKMLFDIINDATIKAGLPDGWISLMQSRDDVKEMLSQEKYIDLIIPRGSNSFVKYIMDNSNIPVMGHADGICHTYVDEHSDILKAVDVCVDAKTQYVAVCNATETLLVHKNISSKFLPMLKKAMDKANVILKGCEETIKIIDIEKADDIDWDTEYLDYILSVKIVDDITEAINHINEHGSRHTDAIISNDNNNVELFSALVDSAGVFINCSTRFSDGFVYGFGAEVGISTSKLHARGPVGIEGLMTYKYILDGDYDSIAPFKTGEKKFTHKDILS